ncbi:MAG TPA: SDR family oxidoreductase [Caulobacteraceae bacterium]|nr:SDR family oxidoreductase [Caulobacteraceae bacterium]
MSGALRGRKVVVIGGSSGIGLALAAAALADGAEVVVGSSGLGHVQAAVERLGAAASGHGVDVRDEADVARFFDRVGDFDHLAFTAGDWGGRGARDLADTDLARAAELFAVRFWGALAAVKHGVKAIRPGGSIVLTNGMIAHRPRQGTPISTAMAGAIEHLTRGLAVDLAPVRVNAVCPGMIRTDVWNSIPQESRESRFGEMTRRQPLARIGEPAEVAEAYLYLMRAGYTTGQVLLVDGGGSVV